MRHEIEGTGLPQAQLLWRKVRGAEGSARALPPLPYSLGCDVSGP
jgi:hypothetical protein